MTFGFRRPALVAALGILMATLAGVMANDAVYAQTADSLDTHTVTRTTARLLVTLSEAPGTQIRVYFRHRPSTGTAWTTSSQTTTSRQTTFDMTGLTPGTTYMAEASTSADYSGAASLTFTTTSVSDVDLRSVGPAAMEVLVTVRHPTSAAASGTVYVRYQVEGSGSWTDGDNITGDQDADRSGTITGLTAGTTYVVEASLESGFPTPGTESATHTHVGTRLIYFDVVDHNFRQITDLSDVAGNDAAVASIPNSWDRPLAATEMDGWFYIVNDATNHLWRSRTPLTASTYTDMGEIGSSLAKIDGLAAKDGVLYAFSKDVVYRVPDPTDPDDSVTGRALPSTVVAADAWCVVCGATTVDGTVYFYFLDNDNIYRVSDLNTPSSATAITISGLPSGFTSRTMVEFNGRLLLNDEPDEDLYEITGFETGTTATATKVGDYNGASSNVTAMSAWSGNPAAIVDQVTVDPQATHASVTITATKADADGQTFYIRWREGSGSWTDGGGSGTGVSHELTIPDLEGGTTYNYQASMDENFPADDRVTGTFTTLTAPTLAANPTFTNLDHDSVSISVSITNADSAEETLYGRYRVNTSGTTFVDLDDLSFSGTSASWELDGLEPDTQYLVQVSLVEGDFALGTARQGHFTTHESASISAVAFTSVTGVAASADVTLTNDHSQSVEVYLRYSEDGQNSWTAATAQTTSGTSTSFTLSGLDNATTYDVEVSLESDYSGATTGEFTTRGLSVTPEPGTVWRGNDYTYTVGGTGVTAGNWSLSQTGTVIVMEDNPDFLDCSDSSPTTSMNAEAIAYVRGCTNGTATLTVTDSGDSTVSRTFTVTVADQPLLPDSIVVSAITATTATVTVEVDNPHGSAGTIWLHYREDGTTDWTLVGTHTTTLETDGVFSLTGLEAFTTYNLRASSSNTYAADQTITEDFTTEGSVALSPSPATSDPVVGNTSSFSVVSSSDITQWIVRLSSGSLGTLYQSGTPSCDSPNVTQSGSFTSINVRWCGTGTGTLSIEKFGDDTVSTSYSITVRAAAAGSVSGVTSSGITATAATLTFTINSPDSANVYAYWRIKEVGDTNWVSAFVNGCISTGSDCTESFSGLDGGLQPGTDYRVGVRWDDEAITDFASTQPESDMDLLFNFSTLNQVLLDPEPGGETYNRTTVTEFDFGGGGVDYANVTITPGTGSAVVGTADTVTCSGGATTVNDVSTSASIFIRWCGQGSVTVRAEDSSDSTVYTEYSVTVDQAPFEVTGFTVDQIDDNSARGVATISNPDGRSETLTFRIGAQDSGTYAADGTLTVSTSGTSVQATHDFDSLDSNTAYTAQVCDAICLSHNFTTNRTSATLSGVALDGDAGSTTATVEVTLTNADSASAEVFIRYRTPVGSGAWNTSVGSQTVTTTTATFNLSGLTSGETYRVQASIGNTFATTVEVDFTTASPTVDSISVSSKTRTSATISVVITDADGTDQTYNIRWRTPAATGSYGTAQTFTSSVSSASYTITGLTAGTTYRVQVDENSGFGSPESVDFTTTANNAPAFSSATVTRTVEENVGAGVHVGAPVTATDAEGDTLTYSLGGTDAASFAIGASTGQITVGSGVTIDYETKASYSLTVTATDTSSGTATVTVTVTVIDVREAGLLGRIVFAIGGSSSSYGYRDGVYGTLVSGDFPGDLFGDGNDRDVDSIYEDADGNWYFVYDGGANRDWLTDQDQLDNIIVEVSYEDERDHRSFVLGGFIEARSGNVTLKLNPPLPDRDWDTKETQDVILDFRRRTTAVTDSPTVRVSDPSADPDSLADFVLMVTPGGGIMIQLMLVIAFATALLWRQPKSTKAILLSGVGFVLIPLAPAAVGFGDSIAAGLVFVNTGLGAFTYQTIFAHTE